MRHKGELSLPIISVIIIASVLIMVAITLWFAPQPLRDFVNNAKETINSAFTGIPSYGTEPARIKEDLNCDNPESEVCEAAKAADTKLKPFVESMQNVVTNELPKEFRKTVDENAKNIDPLKIATDALVSKTESSDQPQQLLGAKLSAKLVDAQCNNEIKDFELNLFDLRFPKLLETEIDLSKEQFFEEIRISISKGEIRVDALFRNGPDEAIRIFTLPVLEELNFEINQYYKEIDTTLDFKTSVPITYNIEGFNKGPGIYKFSIAPEIKGNKKSSPTLEMDICVIELLTIPPKLKTTVDGLDARIDIVIEYTKLDEGD